ncbi:hypothetical protein BDR26DRAFT_151529 [Obelidium mucronatum]|nr:hypothetical protein BDR26DRAFT_151529 [Obelidium mucronatum]
MPSQQTIYRAFPLLLMTIALMNIQSSVVAQPADSCVFDPVWLCACTCLLCFQFLPIVWFRPATIAFPSSFPENQAETMLADVCANDPRKPACFAKASL